MKKYLFIKIQTKPVGYEFFSFESCVAVNGECDSVKQFFEKLIKKGYEIVDGEHVKTLSTGEQFKIASVKEIYEVEYKMLKRIGISDF